MEQWGGKTCYRKHFEVPKEWGSEKVIIEFEAIRQVAVVYCNEIKVVSCENGFVPFGADLSPHLRFGETNIISID
jgi:beta-galactosidase